MQWTKKRVRLAMQVVQFGLFGGIVWTITPLAWWKHIIVLGCTILIAVTAYIGAALEKNQ